MNQDLSACVREILQDREPRRIPDPKVDFVHAGVLIPLLEQEGEPRILFTRRSRKVEHHKGQISFPGGVVEPDDPSLKATALREAREEIGLFEKDVEILGRLDDARTISTGYIVHPFIGSVPHPYDYVLSEREVDEILLIPLSVFHPENTRTRGDRYEHRGEIVETPTYSCNGDVIWGATARIMENLMGILVEKIDLPVGGG